MNALAQAMNAKVATLEKGKIEQRRCLTCRHWQFTVDANGECRRYAPRATLAELTDDLYKAWHDEPRYGAILWPETDEDDRCGEWQEQPGSLCEEWP